MYYRGRGLSWVFASAMVRKVGYLVAGLVCGGVAAWFSR